MLNKKKSLIDGRKVSAPEVFDNFHFDGKQEPLLLKELPDP